MLSLAQKKFDQLRKHNRERASSVRYGRTTAKMRSNESQEETKISQLLSSLLYLSLMMHKVDAMKKILEASDVTLYNEWNTLLESLHSPLFHLSERRLSNERVKKMFHRKRKYKELHEETRASLAKLENTSQQLSHALSNMSEENLKSQGLLEEKSQAEKILAAAEKQVDHLQEQLQKRETEVEHTKAENLRLQSTLQDAEIEKAKLAQKIQDDETSATNVASELKELKNVIEEKGSKLQSVERQLVATEKDRDSLHQQLQSESAVHARILEDKEKQIAESKANCTILQSLLDNFNTEMKELERRSNEEKGNLQQSLAVANKSTELIKAEVQFCQGQVTTTRAELESTANALDKALEASRLEALNQNKLQEMIASKDRDINHLNESNKGSEIKLVQVESQGKFTIQAHEDGISKLQLQISCLEDQAREGEEKQQQISGDIEQARTMEAKLRAENASLESSIAALNEKVNEISTEAASFTTENMRLTEVLETMKESMEQAVHSASKTQEAVEATAKETESEILATKLQLAKAQVEVDVLKASNASFERSFSEALHAKSITEDRELSFLQLSIKNLNEENRQLSQKMETVRDSLMGDMKEALQKQIAAEMKASELEAQLKKASACPTDPVSSDPAVLHSTRVVESLSHEGEYARQIVTNVMSTAMERISPSH